MTMPKRSQKLLGVGAECRHPAGRRLHRVVVVTDARHGQTGPRGVSHVVVKDKDAASAQRVAQQAFDFRVVDALDLSGE